MSPLCHLKKKKKRYSIEYYSNVLFTIYVPDFTVPREFLVIGLSVDPDSFLDVSEQAMSGGLLRGFF